MTDLFPQYSGAVEAKNKPRAFFFRSNYPDVLEIPYLDEDGNDAYFGIYGDKQKKTPAPKWITDLAREWYKNEKPSWLPYGASCLWLFENYLVDHVDGLRMFDMYDDEIDVKEAFADDVEY